MEKGLADLLGPESVSEFQTHYARNEPVCIPHGEGELRGLRDLPFLQSLESLLARWPYEIQAHLPDLRDESSAVESSAADAPKLFRNGMGLLFNDVDRVSGELKEWVMNLRRDLGLSELTYGRCLVYATPDGKGTAPHFDQNINFVLQIHGTKIWSMAPNTSVLNPLSRHTMAGEPDPELASYVLEPLPKKMPPNAKQFSLAPGTLLYVPRGYWHSTEAAGDSLALNFTFTAPSWIDLFTTALRSRLALSPEWRETAHDSGADRFSDLLETLVSDLPNWRAEDILSVTEGDPSRDSSAQNGNLRGSR